jgi:hypothetical protein
MLNVNYNKSGNILCRYVASDLLTQASDLLQQNTFSANETKGSQVLAWEHSTGRFEPFAGISTYLAYTHISLSRRHIYISLSPPPS